MPFRGEYARVKCVTQYCRYSYNKNGKKVENVEITLFLYYLEQLSERMRSKSIIPEKKKKSICIENVHS